MSCLSCAFLIWMKNMGRGRLILFLLPAALLSCQRMDNAQEPVERQFRAITEAAGNDTRTFIDDDLNVLWNGGDVVNVYMGKNKPVTGYAPVEAEGKSETTISVKEDNPGSSSAIVFPVDEEDIAFNAAYYPKVSGSIICQDSKYSIKVTVPDTQTYAENSFGRDAFHMVAVTDDVNDTDFRFRNVMGALRLQLTGNATIRKIIFSGNNAEQLYGSATVSLTGDPELKFTGSTDIITNPVKNYSVTLDCGEGVALKGEEATSFFIALAPCVFWNGFSILVIDSEGGRMMLSSHNQQTIKRSTVLTMPSREYAADDMKFVDLGLSVKWAAMNLGASDTSPAGDYYAWGETSPRDIFSDSNYSGPSVGSGGVSVLYYTLKSENDAATVNLGNLWRMPTKDEFNELLTKCDIYYSSTDRGWYAAKRGDDQVKVFFPATGMKTDRTLQSHQGYYWTSSLNDSDNSYAWCCFFDPSGDKMPVAQKRVNGLCIRPVSAY